MRAKTSDFIVNNKLNETLYYTIKGNENFKDDDGFYRLSTENEKVYAKAIKNKVSKNFSVKNEIGYSYYIKSRPNRVLYDPWDVDAVGANRSRSFINKICKSELTFIEVTQSIFNKYINYLKSENNKWLVEAQREIK